MIPAADVAVKGDESLRRLHAQPSALQPATSDSR
jgi:hypothetical protein